jgi:hypothetical protein
MHSCIRQQIKTYVANEYCSVDDKLTSPSTTDSLYESWRREREKLVSEQAPPDVRAAQQASYKHFKAQEAAGGVGSTCVKSEVQGQQVLDCTWKRRSSITSDTEFLASWSNKGKVGTTVRSDTIIRLFHRSSNRCRKDMGYWCVSVYRLMVCQ